MTKCASLADIENDLHLIINFTVCRIKLSHFVFETARKNPKCRPFSTKTCHHFVMWSRLAMWLRMSFFACLTRHKVRENAELSYQDQITRRPWLTLFWTGFFYSTSTMRDDPTGLFAMLNLYSPNRTTLAPSSVSHPLTFLSTTIRS